MRYFAFPVCFLFLSVPWLFDIEYPLVQGLMRWNTVLVAGSLQHIGIYAVPAGNIIQMQNSQLGVEEACSGILSLQASLVIGCWKVIFTGRSNSVTVPFRTPSGPGSR